MIRIHIISGPEKGHVRQVSVRSITEGTNKRNLVAEILNGILDKDQLYMIDEDALTPLEKVIVNRAVGDVLEAEVDVICHTFDDDDQVSLVV